MNRSLLALALLALAAPLPAQPARKDLAGDPLPKGALARMGSLRLRSDITLACAAFAPDGKALVTAGQSNRLTFWDQGTGKPARTLSVGSSNVYSLAFSRDGKVLALGCDNGMARLIDPDTGTEKRALVDPLNRASAVNLALSPDGKVAVMIHGHGKQLVFWDAGRGELKLRIRHTNHDSSPIVFTPDSKHLVTVWTDGRLHLVDASTGKSVRNLEPAVPANSSRFMTRIAALALTPDGKQLIYRESSGPFFHVLDVGTARAVRKWQRAKEPVYSPSGTLAVTPDGRFLLEGSGEQRVKVWDIAKGKVVRELPAPGLAVHSLALSRDGKRAATVAGNAVFLWDVVGGKRLHADSGHQHTVSQAAFTPDGKKLVSLGPGTMRLWEADTGRPLGLVRLEVSYPISHLSARPGGKAVRWAGPDWALYEWKLDEARPTRLTSPKTVSGLAGQAVSPDGKLLAGIRASDRKLRLIDILGGKPDRDLAVVPNPYFNQLAFSPDGRTLALSSSQDRALMLFDAGSATALRKLMPPSPQAGVPAVTFAPDGRSLLVHDGDFRLIEVLGGGERLRLPRESFPAINRIAWSADGRLGARAQGDGVVVVHDTFTGRELFRRDTGQGALYALAFSRDGRKLATGGASTTLLVWQLPAPQKPRLDLDEKQAWNDLEDNDAGRVFRAMVFLLGQPGDTVKLIGARLRPRPPADPRRIDQLIKDLDDDAFAVREKASRDLAEMGPLAVAALKKAAKSGSLEVRRRAQDLLRKLQGGGIAPDRLRAFRAVEVLDRIGTPAARVVLKNLLAGKLDPALEASIRASLRRLAEEG
jgi:WD40 repeat protein